MLRFAQKDGQTIIYDSRSGQAIEHQVGQVGRRLIEAFEKPKRAVDLAKELSDLPGLDFEKEIGALQQKGLLLQEGDKFISLVLRESTALS